MSFHKTAYRLHLQHHHTHLIYQINNTYNSYNYFYSDKMTTFPFKIKETHQSPISQVTYQPLFSEELYELLIEKPHTFGFRSRNILAQNEPPTRILPSLSFLFFQSSASNFSPLHLGPHLLSLPCHRQILYIFSPHIPH